MAGDRPNTWGVDKGTSQLQRDIRERRICIKCKGRIVFLDRDTILWIEAAGNYLQLYTSGETFVVRDTMSEFGDRLDPERFVRIHRSVIVNIDHISELKPWHTGEHVLTLTNGKELTLSRKYRSSLAQITAQGGCSKRSRRSGLAMKERCEKCDVPLRARTPAFICTHECTFCQACTDAMNHVCPNCGGELGRRPFMK